HGRRLWPHLTMEKRALAVPQGRTSEVLCTDRHTPGNGGADRAHGRLPVDERGGLPGRHRPGANLRWRRAAAIGKGAVGTRHMWWRQRRSTRLLRQEAMPLRDRTDELGRYRVRTEESARRLHASV